MNQSPISEPEPSHSPSALLASGSSHPPLEKFTVTPLSASNGYSKDVPESKSTPWYRTTKGVAIIIVVALVLVGVAVGVVVSVTKNKKGSSMSGAVRDQTQPSASSNTPAGGIIPTPGVGSPTPSPLTTASGFVSRSSGFALSVQTSSIPTPSAPPISI